MNYKSFKISKNATLRVRPDRIVATVSSTSSSNIELYVAGVANPWHLAVDDNHSAAEIVESIWDVKEEN
jgi:hypothetical protein